MVNSGRAMFISFSGFRLVLGCSVTTPTGGLARISPPLDRPGLRIITGAIEDCFKISKSQIDGLIEARITLFNQDQYESCVAQTGFRHFWEKGLA
jgi:hypothetical protein